MYLPICEWVSEWIDTENFASGIRHTSQTWHLDNGKRSLVTVRRKVSPLRVFTSKSRRRVLHLEATGIQDLVRNRDLVSCRVPEPMHGIFANILNFMHFYHQFAILFWCDRDKSLFFSSFVSFQILLTQNNAYSVLILNAIIKLNIQLLVQTLSSGTFTSFTAITKKVDHFPIPLAHHSRLCIRAVPRDWDSTRCEFLFNSTQSQLQLTRAITTGQICSWSSAAAVSIS